MKEMMLISCYLQIVFCWLITVSVENEIILPKNAKIVDIARVLISKHRVKRSTRILETLYIQSTTNSGSMSDMVLQLTTNPNLVVNNIEWRSKRGRENVVSSCTFLSGTLKGTVSSSASVVHCDQDKVSGVIIRPDTQLFIEPWNVTGTHVLYQLEHEKVIDVSEDQNYSALHKRSKRLVYRANITEISTRDEYDEGDEDFDSSWEDIELQEDSFDETTEGTELGSGLPQALDRGDSVAAVPQLEDVGYLLDKLWEQETISEWRPNLFVTRVTKIQQAPRWLKLALTVDHSVISFHGRDQVELYILSLMNIVSAVYKDPSLDSNLRLAIVKLLFLEDAEDCKVVEGSSKASLESVNRWNEEQAQGTSDEKPQLPSVQRDAAIWLTRVDLGGPSGYAPVSGVCDPARSCTLNRDEGLTSAFIIAHELGHVLGLSHDGDLSMGNNCTAEAQRGSVMAAMVSATFHRFHWSRCSRIEFHSKAEQWTCLSKRPLGTNTTLLNSLVNASFSMDEQCRMEFGDGFSLCRSFDLPMPCAYLWCSHETSPQVCRTKKGPPLEGTECGPNHWCVSGLCEEMDTGDMVASLGLAPVLHNSRDGGWSAWSDWQPCSKTCGFGVSFRTRACDNPTAQYGGANCYGKTEEFRICAHQRCRHPLTDFRAEQCAALSQTTRRNNSSDAKYSKKNTSVWMPVELEDTHLKCHLVCVSRESGKQLRTSDYLIDGTPCSYDQSRSDICIQGLCHKLSCDGELESGKQHDWCGVCGGQNEECQNVTTHVSKLIRRHTTKIGILPQGARQVSVKISITVRNRHLPMNNMTKNLIVRNRQKESYRLRTQPNLSVVAGSKFRIKSTKNATIVSTTSPLLSELILLITTGEEQRKKNRLRLHAEISYVLHSMEMELGEYRWELGGWGPCSASCGGVGQQQRTMACRHTLTGKIVPRKHCSLVSRPRNMPMQACTSPKCSFYWMVGPWEHCSTTCGSRGQEYREVYCVATNASKPVAVHPAFCSNQAKPTVTQPCNRIPCPVQWETGNWTQCSTSCGKGVSRRNIRCLAPRGEPLYHCGAAPADVKSCQVQECSTNHPCENQSFFCGLPLLQRYCILPVFQQICCAECTFM